MARRQLLDAGLTERVIDRRARDGRLLKLHRGVYAVGHRRLRREGYWLAAVLAVPGAVLSHRDAAGLHGIRPANHRDIEVTVARGATGQRGIRVHRTRLLDDDDVTTAAGIPVTTIARTLVDLAGVVPRDHLTRAIKEANARRMLDVHALERALARTKGRRGPGHAAVKEALAELDALATTLTRSPLEDAFLRLVHKAGMERPRTNARVGDFEVDALWPAHRLVVELDGWAHHQTKHAFQEDRTRDADLTAAGYRVVRFTHHAVTRDPDRILETLRRLGVR